MFHAAFNRRLASERESRVHSRSKTTKKIRYAVQFATMATVYSLTWIFFRVFPAVIGNTEHLYIYGYGRWESITDFITPNNLALTLNVAYSAFRTGK